MSDGRNVTYFFDGSFDGLMCCFFESCTQKEMPSDIIAEIPEQLSFGEIKQIITVPENAERVIASIPTKMSEDMLGFIKTAFLTCEPRRYILIIRLLYKGYRYGAKTLDRLTDNTVDALLKAVQHCTREAHLLKGFVRFTDSDGALSAVISPKNTVLPLIANHFIDRYRNESFLIFDSTHKMALVYRNYSAEIISAEDYIPPDADETELFYRSLWQRFYDTIGIKERYNPKCRMTLMPKRYWANMTEMKKYLGETDKPRQVMLESAENNEYTALP